LSRTYKSWRPPRSGRLAKPESPLKSATQVKVRSDEVVQLYPANQGTWWLPRDYAGAGRDENRGVHSWIRSTLLYRSRYAPGCRAGDVQDHGWRQFSRSDRNHANSRREPLGEESRVGVPSAGGTGRSSSHALADKRSHLNSGKCAVCARSRSETKGWSGSKVGKCFRINLASHVGA
jgi:hypothetical protein